LACIASFSQVEDKNKSPRRAIPRRCDPTTWETKCDVSVAEAELPGRASAPRRRVERCSLRRSRLRRSAALQPKAAVSYPADSRAMVSCANNAFAR
jgi:hypothetical protein